MSYRSFEELVDEAEKAHFEGWDFSYLKDRWHTEALPWDYCGYVRQALRGVRSVLDLGTGGGEVLASLAPLPARAVATEGHAPNVEVARERLEPLGVQVVDTSGHDLNHDRFPFSDEEFDLIIDRHTGGSASELWRCLAGSGSYITEQVGRQDVIELREWFGEMGRSGDAGLTLDVVAQQLAEVGFTIVHAQEARPECSYRDVGAVIYHLRAIPWIVPGFDVAACRDRLLDLHEHIRRHAGFVTRHHRLLVHARKSTA